MFTKKMLGTMLQQELQQPYDVMKITQWAEHIYANHCRALSKELHLIISALTLMEEGPEFEFTEQELKMLSDKLINEEFDPLEQINKLKKD